MSISSSCHIFLDVAYLDICLEIPNGRPKVLSTVLILYLLKGNVPTHQETEAYRQCVPTLREKVCASRLTQRSRRMRLQQSIDKNKYYD